METGAGLIVHETDGEHDELASAPWFFRGAFLVFTAPSVQTGARPIDGRWSADGTDIPPNTSTERLRC